MMLRPLFAALIVVAGTLPALAYCPVVPDDKSTGYTTNGALHALCLEAELAQATALKNAQALQQNQLDALQRDYTAFKINETISSFNGPAFTNPSFSQPAWP